VHLPHLLELGRLEKVGAEQNASQNAHFQRLTIDADGVLVGCIAADSIQLPLPQFLPQEYYQQCHLHPDVTIPDSLVESYN
jgi:hypothetical protein